MNRETNTTTGTTFLGFQLFKVAKVAHEIESRVVF